MLVKTRNIILNNSLILCLINATLYRIGNSSIVKERWPQLISDTIEAFVEHCEKQGMNYSAKIKFGPVILYGAHIIACVCYRKIRF